jgi:hypothetical protein
VPNDYLPLADALGGLSGEQITFLESLKSHDGNASQAARSCGISVARHYQWRRTDESYRTILAHIADAAIDQIEAALMREAVSGNVQAASLLLKAWGRHRGYGDRLDLNVSDDTKQTYVVSYSTIAGPSDN